MAGTQAIRNKRRTESGLAYLVTGTVILTGALALLMFGKLEQVPGSYVALAAGVVAGGWLFRWRNPAWVAVPVLFGSLALCLLLAFTVADAVGFGWIGGFVAGTNLGTGWRSMALRRPGQRPSGRPTVASVRDDVLAAVAGVLEVARAEADPHRARAAEHLEKAFTAVTDKAGLREAAGQALSLYGGAGSFSDTGTEASTRAVIALQDSLHTARSPFVRN